MKWNNETKIGVLAVVAISLFYIGFKYIKGINLFQRGNFVYVSYTDTKGLLPSNPVMANGLQVGAVYDIEPNGTKLDKLVVAIKLNGTYDIPKNSIAYLKTAALGGSSIEIQLGDSPTNIAKNDTLAGIIDGGLLETLSKQAMPLSQKLDKSLAELQTLLGKTNQTFDSASSKNLQAAIANFAKISANLVATTQALQAMVANQNSSLQKTLANAENFSKNLADNNAKITATLSNIEATTDKLAKSNIDGMINKLDASAEALQTTMQKLTTTEGTAGKLLNDDELYRNLANTILSLNILMDDLRAHPKRYVQLSVFGKKDKGNYLTAPLPVDSTKK
ncbi:MAG: MCE family protein [Bacteroidetes bacterium]|nr:MAG: MCE family protein [Bacteroidota bacterium]TAF98304.1 MAG: MCE family protein [Bacteroidota bacterium]